jgi:archaeal flagellar protein FlaJ
MKITNKIIKKIATISGIAAAIFFVITIAIGGIPYLLSASLDYMIVIALTIAIAPPSIATVIHNRWKNKIEKALPEFLRDLATASKTGIPLQVALEHASKRNYGPLTIELKQLVAHMSWGMNFNEAMNEFSKRIDILLIKKATVLIIEAGKHGGDLSNIFESTANYADNVNAWTLKRKMQTMPYVAIFYFSVFIFLFIIIIISNMMFAPMSEMSSNGISFIKPVLTTEQSRRVFLHTALLESVFGGLIAGKINEDTYTNGLKHVMVLCIVSGVAFYLFFH